MSTDPPLRRPTTAGLVPVGPRRRRNALHHWGASAAISAATLAATADLGEHVYHRAPGTFDAGTRAWALAHQTPGRVAVFGLITRIGAPPLVLTLAVLVALWLWRARDRFAAAVLLAAPAIAIVLFNLVKTFVRRTRPAAGLLLRDVTFSFPSGHATVSAAVFGTLGWVLAREGKLSWPVAIPLAILCPLLIGVSRVYLDVHWATDVLAGWCLGIAVAALSDGVYERGRRRRAHAV